MVFFVDQIIRGDRFDIVHISISYVFFMQLQQKIDLQQKSYQTLEVKFNRCHSDMTSSQNALEEVKEEYEKYKVRAHNVLKQQKESGNTSLLEKHQNEM